LREPTRRLTAADAAATRAIGARFAAALRAADPAEPLLIGLSGELGAGKTTFVAGLLEALGHAGPVRSPTYALIEPYRLADRDVHHCDLYRLRDPEELVDLGLRDLLTARSVLLVEWPERAGDRLRPPDLSL
jgi:tRNA threonylcarbamoyladenosine biosynthesis protein TsaE